MNRILPLIFFMLTFIMGARLDPHIQEWAGTTLRSQNALAMLLGDGRRMFANHFYVKSDAYFHSGYYPTIYDNNEAFKTPHIAEDSGASQQGHNTGDENDFLGKPTDWIDAFGRRFYPAHHTHLNEGGVEGSSTGQEREILPWLRLSVELDPNHIESYLVAAYWLRNSLHKVDEAEQFLRDGLRTNPDSYEILHELGRVAFESRHDLPRAHNLWLAALQRWKRTQAGSEEPDWFMLRNILSCLSLVEEKQGHLDEALAYLRQGKASGGGTDLFNRRIAELEKRTRTYDTSPAK